MKDIQTNTNGSQSRHRLIYKILIISVMLFPQHMAGGEFNYTPLPQTIEQKIELAFGEYAELMKKVAMAESGMNPEAVNPEWHNGCQGSYGLFQIACVNYQGNPDDLKDPDLNIQVAKRVLAQQGIKAWGVCRKHVDCSVY